MSFMDEIDFLPMTNAL